MFAVGRSRLAASSGLAFPKLNVILTKVLARYGPLSSGAINSTNQASIAPFVKANLPLLTSIVLRNYATATKKKTTKTAAKKKKKATATPKKRTTATKKPAAKRRTVAKKTGTRRTSTKKAVKKKPAAKKKPVKKKKVAKKAADPKKPGIRTNLKNSLMDEPPKRMTAYNVFYIDQLKENPGTPMVEAAKLSGAKWRALSDAEKKPYVDRAAAEVVKRKAAYDQWLAKLNPAAIQAANIARSRVRKYRLETGRGSVARSLKDPRLVKPRITAWIFYVKDNINKPDIAALDRLQKMKKLSQNFKTITDAEKKKYSDLAARDKVRYETEKAEFAKKYIKA